MKYFYKKDECDLKNFHRYDEIKDYNFTDPTKSTGKVTGHFTQVVWKASTKLGIGKGTGKKGSMACNYVVARYAPAGNIRGEYKANVLPKK